MSHSNHEGILHGVIEFVFGQRRNGRWRRCRVEKAWRRQYTEKSRARFSSILRYNKYSLTNTSKQCPFCFDATEQETKNNYWHVAQKDNVKTTKWLFHVPGDVRDSHKIITLIIFHVNNILILIFGPLYTCIKNSMAIFCLISIGVLLQEAKTYNPDVDHLHSIFTVKW